MALIHNITLLNTSQPCFDWFSLHGLFVSMSEGRLGVFSTGADTSPAPLAAQHLLKSKDLEIQKAKEGAADATLVSADEWQRLRSDLEAERAAKMRAEAEADQQSAVHQRALQEQQLSYEAQLQQVRCAARLPGLNWN